MSDDEFHRAFARLEELEAEAAADYAALGIPVEEIDTYGVLHSAFDHLTPQELTALGAHPQTDEEAKKDLDLAIDVYAAELAVKLGKVPAEHADMLLSGVDLVKVERVRRLVDMIRESHEERAYWGVDDDSDGGKKDEGEQ